MKPLLGRIERGELDPSRVITHRLPLSEAPHGYEIFKHKKDGCEKVVLTPWRAQPSWEFARRPTPNSDARLHRPGEARRS